MPTFRIQITKQATFSNTHKYDYKVIADTAEEAYEKAMAAAESEPLQVDVGDHDENCYCVTIDHADSVVSLVK